MALLAAPAVDAQATDTIRGDLNLEPIVEGTIAPGALHVWLVEVGDEANIEVDLQSDAPGLSFILWNGRGEFAEDIGTKPDGTRSTCWTAIGPAIWRIRIRSSEQRDVSYRLDRRSLAACPSAPPRPR